jgi:galactose mutarotase-like enzyme
VNVTSSKTTWHGLDACVLENDVLQTVMVPDLGAKLVSLLDKRSHLEWLVGPGNRPVKKIPYGASFQEQDMCGWDEMFPTIIACAYPGPGDKHGAFLPDHGEVWTLPWVVDRLNDGKVTLSVTGQALPYRLTRTAEYTAPATLQLHYQLVNLGLDRMPFIWAAHPQFACGEGAKIIFPAQITTVCNTIPEVWGWGAPETHFDWPTAITVDGNQVPIDQIGPPSLHRARKFFVLPNVRAGWVGLVRRPSNAWLRMDWDPNLVPYLGLWADEGALNTESVATPEPTTGFYDSLAVAWNKKEITHLEPGAAQSWTVSVRLGTGEHPFWGHGEAKGVDSDRQQVK